MKSEERVVPTEKFSLMQDISVMLPAPWAVQCAWQEGWSDIAFHPEGYVSMDSCGCCFTEYPPGWYGYSTKMRPLRTICKEPFLREWKFICDPNGGQEYTLSFWDILDSH